MLSQYVDVAPLALHGGAFQGTFPVAAMIRLLPLLHMEEGEAIARLFFVRSPQGYLLMTGSLEARLTLLCQRCLESMILPIEITLNSVILPSMEEAERFEDDRYEPVIAEGGSFDLWAALEDEIILSLPVFPKHAEGEICRVNQETTLSPIANEPPVNDEDTPKRENPFTVLKKLL